MDALLSQTRSARSSNNHPRENGPAAPNQLVKAQVAHAVIVMVKRSKFATRTVQSLSDDGYDFIMNGSRMKPVTLEPPPRTLRPPGQTTLKVQLRKKPQPIVLETRV